MIVISMFMSQIETMQSGSFIYTCLTLYSFHLFSYGLIIDSLSKNICCFHVHVLPLYLSSLLGVRVAFKHGECEHCELFLI